MNRKVFVLAAVLSAFPALAHANFLFDSYLTPSFDGDPNTEFSKWSVFYSVTDINYPDQYAPNGDRQAASAAGFTPPADSNLPDPLAFWHLSNPTIQQTLSAEEAGFLILIRPGTDGNIYSPSATLKFELADTTPYTPETVVFQFQTDGTEMDLGSIKLIGTTASGTVELTPDEYIREYFGGSSGFGGNQSRVALQWDLRSLGITSYKILFDAAGSSLSLQEALLDTSAVFASVVPESRTWLGTGSQNWSAGSNWEEGSTSEANGNVKFANTGNAAIALDGDRTVGELIVQTSSDITISGQAGSKLTVNTGISTGASAGLITIDADYVVNALNVFALDGGEVHLNGVVSGGYGIVKTGAGKLVLTNDNTFGSTSGGVSLQGGTLRMEGVNSYVGATGLLWGRLEVAANAFAGMAGALGNSSSAIAVGATSATFSDPGEAAHLVIDGDFTVGRNVELAAGTYAKGLGATNTTNGATFGGNVTFGGTTSNVRFFAEGAADKVTFSGAMTGGAIAQTVTINGAGNLGTVVYSGGVKAYSNSTTVASGTLLMAAGSGYSGNGHFTVANGAILEVDGTLSGTGTFSLQSGGTLTGSGSVNRTVVTGGVLSVIEGSRGEVLTLASLDASSGVRLSLEVGNVAQAANALLSITGEFKASLANEGIGIFITDAGSLLAGIQYTLFTFGSQSQFSLADLKLLNDGLVVDSWTIGANSVQVQFASVPEPSTWALILGAILAGVVWRVRRQRHA